MSVGDRSLQRNAADPRQVRFAERKERRREEDFQQALRAVMATLPGRLVMWRLLERAGVYRSVFDASGSKTYYNAGRQDFGHELLATITAADPDGFLEMEREARAAAINEQIEASAVQTPAASRGQ